LRSEVIPIQAAELLHTPEPLSRKRFNFKKGGNGPSKRKQKKGKNTKEEGKSC